MNLRDLEYFIAVAELKHFGQAAAKVFVSQPTLSMQLKKLEEYLGVVLFERTNKQVALTPAGAALYPQARAIILAAKNFQEAAKVYKDPQKGKLRLGVIPTIAPYYLPTFLPLMRKHFPELQIEVSEVKTDGIIKNLNEHELDLGLLALPIHEPHLQNLPLFDEPFLLAISYDKRDQVQHIKDIKSQHLLLLEEGHCLRDQALEFCKKAGASAPADIRATSLETIRALVINGVGYTLMPEMAATPTHGLYYKKLVPEPMRTIGFLYRDSAPQVSLFKEMAHGLITQ